jgi:hypothetical protein
MAALDRFYTDVTWTGTIEPNGMGPGSPAMTARGQGVHSRLHDGLWIVGDYRQDQFLTDGTFVLTWRLHWVTGWDTDAGQYRATLNDNYGHARHVRRDQPEVKAGATTAAELMTAVGFQRNLTAADQKPVQRSNVAQLDLGALKSATAIHGTRYMGRRREPTASRYTTGCSTPSRAVRSRSFPMTRPSAARAS